MTSAGVSAGSRSTRAGVAERRPAGTCGAIASRPMPRADATSSVCSVIVSPSTARISSSLVRTASSGGTVAARPITSSSPNGAATATSSGRCRPIAAHTSAAVSMA